jgi:hypothetical protein
MISQSVFSDGGGAVAVADGHGVVLADAAGAGVAPGLVADAPGAGVARELVAGTGVARELVAGAGVARELVAGAGVAREFVGEAAGGVAAVEAMPEAVGAGVAGPVVAGAALADADGVPLSAARRGATAATSDMAGLADPAAADAAQAPAGLLEALSMALICGALRVAIPAASATVRSPIIGAQRARGRCGWSR